MRMALRSCALVAAVAAAPLSLTAGVDRTGRSNLLFITVDTLRADYLGAYGRSGDPTPNLDRLASEGVLFEDVLAVIGKTGPSFASTFTSLYPPTHGARRNGVKMRDDVPILAEILLAEGYQTAAFITNWTLKNHLSGVGRGFEHYDEEFNQQRRSLGGRERDAETVTEAALRWLQDHRTGVQRPLFLWLHYSEPHTPFIFHPGHRAPELAPEERTPQWEKRQKYYSEVSFTDQWIGTFLERSEEYFPRDSTYLLFFSDHGESLGEHNYWGHGKNVHWPNLGVPLILRGPTVPKNRRLPYAVSLIDILPTVLDLLDIEKPTTLAGLSLDGVWTTPPQARERYAFGDKHTALWKKSRARYSHPLEISLQTPTAKAVFEFEKRGLVYFDLVADPMEERALAQPTVDLRPSLGRRLADWYGNLAKFEQRNGTLAEEDIAQLRSLGYID